MARIWELVKVIFKNSGLSSLIFGSKTNRQLSNSKRNLIIVFVSFLIAGAMFAIGIAAFTVLSIAIGEDSNGVTTIDTEYIKNILIIYVPLYFALVLVYNNSLCLSTFYLSKDNSIYVSYPIKSSELFIAKFINILIYGYLIQTILVLPCVIAFDIIVIPGVFTIINEILLFIFFPFIPFTILLLIQSLFANIINYGKHKNFLSFLTFIFAIGIILAMELFTSTSLSFDGELTPELITSFKASIAETASNFKFLSFYSDVFIRTALNNNALSLLFVFLFVVISITMVFFLFLIMAPSYTKILVKNIDIYHKRSKKEELNKIIKNEVDSYKTPFGAYLLKEYRMLTRSTTNVIQLIVPPFLVIAIILITLFTTIYTNSDTAQAMDIIITNMQKLATFDQGFVIYCIEAISCFISMFNLISVTSISREGNNAYLLKSAPTHSYMVILAKIFWPLMLNGIILTIIIWGLGLFFNLYWYILLLVWLGSLIINALAQFAMIAIDIKRPYTNWVNEVDPLKQNLNNFLAILVCFALTFFFVGCALIDYFFVQLNIVWTFIISIILTTLLTLLIVYILKRKGSHVFDNVE